MWTTRQQSLLFSYWTNPAPRALVLLLRCCLVTCLSDSWRLQENHTRRGSLVVLPCGGSSTCASKCIEEIWKTHERKSLYINKNYTHIKENGTHIKENDTHIKENETVHEHGVHKATSLVWQRCCCFVGIWLFWWVMSQSNAKKSTLQTVDFVWKLIFCVMPGYDKLKR